jgi:hypothetical protein
LKEEQMNVQKQSRQRGQVLVLVALSLLALLAFVALAIDGGHIYRERRLMQNAADAGALAGAYELCYGSESQIEPAALEYAIDRNGAELAHVTVQDLLTVTVVTTETVETYFAGLLGFNEVDVQADASAVCGKAEAAGLVWPIGFDETRFPADIDCDTPVVMWEEGKADCDTWNCCAYFDKNRNIAGFLPCENEEPLYPPFDGRSWLDFSAGIVGTTDPCDQTGCGNDELRDRILGFEKKSGDLCQSFLSIPKCIPGDSGVRNTTWVAAGTREDDIVLIPLYDPTRSEGSETPCTMTNDPGNTCSGERYYIVKFGCLRIDGPYYFHELPEEPGGRVGGNRTRIILGHIPCVGEEPDQEPHPECNTLLGWTKGEKPEPGDIKAVSLVD